MRNGHYRFISDRTLDFFGLCQQFQFFGTCIEGQHLAGCWREREPDLLTRFVTPRLLTRNISGEGVVLIHSNMEAGERAEEGTQFDDACNMICGAIGCGTSSII